MTAQGKQTKKMIVYLDELLTSSLNQVRPVASVVTLASLRKTETSPSAFVSDQLLSLVLESGDALFDLVRRHDDDPMVVAILTDELQEVTNLTDGVFAVAGTVFFPFYALYFVAAMAQVVVAFPWEMVIANVLLFSSFEEKKNVSLGAVFGEKANGKTLFFFVWVGKASVNRLSFFVWRKVTHLGAFFADPLVTHFVLVPFSDL